MHPTDIELVALTRTDTYTVGLGHDYAAAIEDARRKALIPHSVCASVLAWRAPLIKVYSRPDHRYGAIVPPEAIAPRLGQQAAQKADT